MRRISIVAMSVILSGLSVARRVDAADKSAPAKSGAHEIVKKMLDKYRSLNSYEGVATEVRAATRANRENKVTACIIYKKPNKFAYRIESASSERRSQSGCDGRTLWAYLPPTREYTSAPAPKDLSGLEKIAPLAATTMDPLAFFRGEDPFADAKGLKQLPDTKLDNKPMNHIAFTKELARAGGRSEAKIDMLIGRDDSLLYKLYKTTNQMVIEGKGMKVKRTSTETHTGVKVNGDIPDKTFQFTPAKNARLVKEFSFIKHLKAMQQGKTPNKALPGKTPGKKRT